MCRLRHTALFRAHCAARPLGSTHLHRAGQGWAQASAAQRALPMHLQSQRQDLTKRLGPTHTPNAHVSLGPP